MKLFFASDIHGSLYYAKKTLEAYEQEQADHLILLGDALYHGPRNPLPKDYNPKEVAALLNKYKQEIIAVRGNCDSEVDQMMIEYPMMGEYAILFYENKRIFATHGHVYNENHLPPLKKGDVLIYGHTHIPMAKVYKDLYILNPGSTTLPKNGSEHSYAVLKEGIFEIKDFNQQIIKSIFL